MKGLFKKILIANRGEIAVRVIRACKELGIATVAVFSEADKNALHVQLADEAVCVGPPKSRDSYLNMYNILSAACKTKAAAIHPGFGFLAENSVFAGMCEECNIKFIGPSGSVIAKMGDKAAARAVMESAGVPVIPGCGIIAEFGEAKAFAKAAGYPVVIKAAAGGGGKGIRIVREPSALEDAFYAAKNEALAAFSDDRVYMEKLIENAKHIEVQVLADRYGNIIHLGERDCSVQRRNQKLLEEAPAICLTDAVKAEIGKAAVNAAAAAGYENAGTIEFLYGADRRFYFMEMNTRIQVEHPVTEMVTGIDIVKEQIKIACGERLSVTQDDVRFLGHAIECRVNAENIKAGFAPSPGRINYLFIPGGYGVRVDSGVFAGYTIPPFYDSMIAKVIAHGATRDEAIARMRRALSEFIIEGVENNIDLQMDILSDEDFLAGTFHTGSLNVKLAQK